jgi:TonB family protein
MNRLQKKCFIVSVSLHGLLLGVFLFGSAFFVSDEKPDNTRILHMISGKLVDDALSSGGNPDVQPVAQPPPAPPPLVEPKPPEPKPKPAPEKAELPKIERPKIEPVHKTFTLPEKTKKPVKPVDTEENTKRESKLDPKELKLVKRNNSEAKAKDTAEAKARAVAEARRRARAVNQVLNTWGKNLSPSTKVDIGGPGGELFATNYRDAVRSIYTAAWSPPDGFTDDTATVTATVTIARDGKVINAHIIDRSGNSIMDRSIERTLENVTFIAPFPEGAKDQERTFTIEFNLKAKRLG